jgi:hypothetical protein
VEAHQVEVPLLLALDADYQPLEALHKPLVHDTLRPRLMSAQSVSTNSLDM